MNVKLTKYGRKEWMSATAGALFFLFLSVALAVLVSPLAGSCLALLTLIECQEQLFRVVLYSNIKSLSARFNGSHYAWHIYRLEQF